MNLWRQLKFIFCAGESSFLQPVNTVTADMKRKLHEKGKKVEYVKEQMQVGKVFLAIYADTN